MYRMLGVPVIPVAVNSGIVYPPHRWVKWSGTITYRIGETIPAGLPREEAEDRVWRAINALNPPEALEAGERSEEHTSELQSLMRISYAVFCLKKKKKTTRTDITNNTKNNKS